MKNIIINIFLVFIILLSGLLCFRMLQSQATEFDNMLTNIEKEIQKENWDIAIVEYQRFSNQWDNKFVAWSMIIDHDEIEKVTASLKEMIVFIQTKEKPHALASISNVKFLLKHIIEKESLTLKNIL